MMNPEYLVVIMYQAVEIIFFAFLVLFVFSYLGVV